jgi:anion-transporting  ArsA/GET3 family ATPase
MAAEKLYDLYNDPRFDLVVVDTPPTRQALDFLSAPARLTRFIDHPLYRILIAPANAGLKVISTLTQPVVRTISKVIGTQALEDTVEFFQAFQGLDAGFRDRAVAVEKVLRDTLTQYVLVSTAQTDAISETQFFTDTLRKQNIEPALLILNRMQPRFADDGLIDTQSIDTADLAFLEENLAHFHRLADAQEESAQVFTHSAPEIPIARAPFSAALLDNQEKTLETLCSLGALLAHAD